jgi:hypothetical protein
LRLAESRTHWGCGRSFARRNLKLYRTCCFLRHLPSSFFFR